MKRPVTFVVLAATLLALSACGQKTLRDLRQTGSGPDEFLVLPPKPLSEPADYSTLPVPTPGGSNLTDTDPRAEAVAALGGKPAALVPGSGVPAGDASLVTASSRYGVRSDIRASLAAEDAALIKRKRRIGGIKIVPVDRYEQIYAKQTLDANAATEAFRRAGVATPTSPPGNE